MKKWHKWLSYLTDIAVEKRQSALSGALFIKWRNGKLVVDTAEVNYAYGSLYTVFEQAFAKYHIQQEVKPQKVLLLGFGAGSVYHLVRETFGKNVLITGVESDPVMLQIYRDYYDQGDGQLALIQEDVQQFIRHSTEKFDLILMDVFIGEHVPKALMEDTFVQSLFKTLHDKGVLMWNLIVDHANQKTTFDQLLLQLPTGHTWIVLNKVNRMIICKKEK